MRKRKMKNIAKASHGEGSNYCVINHRLILLPHTPIRTINIYMHYDNGSKKLA